MADNNKDTLRFVPLARGSQNSTTDVLFFDSAASSEVLYNFAEKRLDAAYSLLECFSSLQENRVPIDISPEVSRVARILLSDANSILKIFKPHENTAAK